MNALFQCDQKWLIKFFTFNIIIYIIFMIFCMVSISANLTPPIPVILNNGIPKHLDICQKILHIQVLHILLFSGSHHL